MKVDRAPGRCAYCKDAVEKDERAACAGCMAVHHAACFREHGACAACGERDALTRDAATRDVVKEPAPRVEPAPAPKIDIIEADAEPRPHYGWQEEPERGFTTGLAVFLFVVLPIAALLLIAAAALMR